MACYVWETRHCCIKDQVRWFLTGIIKKPQIICPEIHMIEMRRIDPSVSTYHSINLSHPLKQTSSLVSLVYQCLKMPCY